MIKKIDCREDRKMVNKKTEMLRCEIRFYDNCDVLCFRSQI